MKFVKPLVLFGTGGFLYYAIEILWRGYSHWTMFLLGGLCFILVGLINEVFKFPLVKQMFLSTVIITTAEFVCGCVVNLWMKWDVWDYSGLPFNIFGQICLPYSILWFFLSFIAIILDDYLRHWLFNEEKPKYKLF